jgi:hypothetical protein
VQQRQAGAPSKAAIQLQRTLAPMALKRAVICAGEPVNTTRPFSMYDAASAYASSSNLQL